MRFALWDHAGKGGYLHQRLLQAGHTTAETFADADLMLLDCDWAWAHPRPELIQAAHSTGAKIALYPHGGLPTMFVYDGLTEPDPLVDLRLEHGHGSIEAAELLGLELKQEAPGWLYSPTRPFQLVDKPRKILFAPQHPNMEMLLNGGTNGHDPGPSQNQQTYRDLLELDFDLTVSVVGPLWRNGIFPHPRARLASNHEMRFEASLPLITEADVVVAGGTMAALAVAMGKPTVMLAQPDLTDYVNGRYQEATHADLYRDLFRYPLDVSDGDLEALIARACASNDEAAAWRTLHIGDDGTTEAIRLLDELVGETVSSTSHVTIEGITAHSTSIGG